MATHEGSFKHETQSLVCDDRGTQTITLAQQYLECTQRVQFAYAADAEIDYRLPADFVLTGSVVKDKLHGGQKVILS